MYALAQASDNRLNRSGKPIVSKRRKISRIESAYRDDSRNKSDCHHGSDHFRKYKASVGAHTTTIISIVLEQSILNMLGTQAYTLFNKLNKNGSKIYA
jgi:hypothetical protein